MVVSKGGADSTRFRFLLLFLVLVFLAILFSAKRTGIRINIYGSTHVLELILIDSRGHLHHHHLIVKIYLGFRTLKLDRRLPIKLPV
jgi:hypothetical protein